MTTSPEIHRPAPETQAEREPHAGTGPREHLHFDRLARVWWQHVNAVDPMPQPFEGGARSRARAA